MDEQNLPVQPALAEPSPPASTETPSFHPLYFPVSIPKLVVMSLCTLTTYQAYWFYMNWRMIKEQGRLDIKPIWRAIFSPLYCYQCFKRIDQTAEVLKRPEGVAAGSLAASYILISVLGFLPAAYALLSLGSFLPLVPVQTIVNDINKAVSPGHDRNARFTGWNILAMLIAVPILVILLFGAFNPRQY